MKDEFKNDPVAFASRPFQTPVGIVSLTRQAMSAECDVNRIVKRFKETGIESHVNNGVARYSDTTKEPDLLSRASVLAETKTLYYDLSPEDRAEYGSVADFLGCMSNPANLAAVVELVHGVKAPEVVNADSKGTVPVGVDKGPGRGPEAPAGGVVPVEGMDPGSKGPENSNV